MNWKQIFLIFLLSICLHAFGDYSIVFVHIGDKLPPYLETAVKQARLFNKECPIVLIASQKALQDMTDNDITYISCESLPKTSEHILFIKNTKFNKDWNKGFWRYTSERFLYLNDFMAAYQIENVFHLENDNMLYVDLGELLPIFQEKYNGIAATFDNDNRCIPGFIYIKNPHVMETLSKCFVDHSQKRITDIEILVRFRDENADLIDTLPIVPEEYVQGRYLINLRKQTVKDKNKYCQHVRYFQSIFDAAAIGQYLGGKDPANGSSYVGFINESCIFNPSAMTYEWISDEQNRKVPYAIYADRKIRINNLHIHSKNLKPFSSL